MKSERGGRFKFNLENSKYKLEDIEYCGEIRFVQALSSMLCVMFKCDLLQLITESDKYLLYILHLLDFRYHR